MVYHQGYRTRAPLYSTAFEMGIKKSKTAVLRALNPLEKSAGTLERCILSAMEAGDRRPLDSEDQKFRKFVVDMFKATGTNGTKIKVRFCENTARCLFQPYFLHSLEGRLVAAVLLRRVLTGREGLRREKGGPRARRGRGAPVRLPRAAAPPPVRPGTAAT